MKNFRTTLLFACVMLAGLCTFAQDQTIPVNEPDLNKPKLFQNMPDIIPISTDQLDLLLNSKLSRQVNTNLSNKSASELRFSGEVVSTASKYDNRIQSVVIRSSNFNGAMLTISKITNEDGTTSFKGRLMSFQASDLYELKNQDGNYVLVKRNYYDLVNE